MRVKVQVTVEVDPREWRFGAGHADQTLAEIREAVRAEVIRGMLAGIDDDPYELLKVVK